MKRAIYEDWGFQRDALRQILRVWAHSLSALEFRAVLFVYDRTLGWGKEWEVITGKQAAKGVRKGSASYAAHISKNRSRSMSCLATLVKGGFLRSKKQGQARAYALNLEHMKKGGKPAPISSQPPAPDSSHAPAPVSSHKEYPKERVPKGQEERPQAVALREGGEHSEEEPNPPSQAQEDAARMKSTVLRVKARSQERQRADAAEGKFARCANSGFVPYRAALPAVWRLKTKQHFPDFAVSPMSKLSLTIFHQYALNWTKARESGEFMEYLEWVFANWRALGAGVFGWMQDFPNTPSVRILTNAKLRTYIEEAYVEREQLARWRKMSEVERNVEHLVHKRGMDRDKATEIVRKRLGYEDELKKLKDAKRDIEVMAHNAQQAIEHERIALSRQRRAEAKVRKPLKQTEGTFGEFEP